MTPLAVAVAILSLAFVLAKRVAQPSLDRLGERLAQWVFPDDRPITYRFARGLARVSGCIAPRGSAARSAVSGVLADIDAIEQHGSSYTGPMTLAASLFPPAVRSRLSGVTSACGEYFEAMVLVPFLAALLVYTLAMNRDVGSALPPPRSLRFASIAVIVGGHCAAAAAASLLGSGAYAGGAALAIASLPFLAADLTILTVGVKSWFENEPRPVRRDRRSH